MLNVVPLHLTIGSSAIRCCNDERHTTNHKDLGAHYHKWKDGKPLDEEPHPLTPAMKKLLDNVSNLS